MVKSLKIMVSCFLLLFVVVKVVNNIFTYNPSISEPVGEYMSLPFVPYHKGDLVLTCISNNNYKHIFNELGMKDEVGSCGNGLPHLIKRIAATEGDEVEVTSQGILINGVLVPKSKQFRQGRGVDLYPLPVGYKHKLAQNEFFMLGNDTHSLDSRYFGIVNKKDVYRRAFLIYAKADNNKGSTK